MWQPINFAAIEPEKSVPDLGSFFGNMLKTNKELSEARIKGEESKHAPAKFEHERFLEGLEKQYKEKQIKAELKEKEAHAKYWEQGGGAGRGRGYAPTQLQKAADYAAKTGEEYGLDSPEYKNALSYYDKIAGTGDTNATKSKRQTIARANVVREYLATEFAKMPYIGFGSSKSNLQDLSEYQTTQDPNRKMELGQRLVNAAVLAKMVPEFATAQQQSQGKTNVTDTDIKHQTKAITMGWPSIRSLSFSNLPPELAKQAEEEHARRLKEIGTLVEGKISPRENGEQSINEPQFKSPKDLEITDEAIMETARKYNISPEQVMQMLNEGR